MRILRFASVGALCFAVQYLAGAAIAWFGVAWPVANAAGFIASAQPNFLMSNAFTWGERKTARLGTLGRRWISYNVTALLALGVNTVVFTMSYRLLGALPAALLGVATGTAFTYLICDRLVFRRAKATTERSAEVMV